jgi:DsbC/DsbD-like thiol-disulfide interchange protein
MTATLLRIALLACLAMPAEALAARSDWASAEQSQLRLLLSDAEDGHIAGGIEILLEPGWYTYWRNPGDAGVPPLFDFAGSDNVAAVEVLYPAPERQDDGTSVSLVYRDEVVLPLAVTPAIPGQSITLRVDARFGVCRNVCIPTGTSSAVTLLPAAEPDPLADARLERYRMRVPKAAEPGRFDVETVTLEGETLLIDVRAPDSSYLDLFADPPANWYVGQPSLVSRAAGVSHYRLELGGRPDGMPIEGQRFRFVAVAGGEAIEKAVEIR